MERGERRERERERKRRIQARKIRNTMKMEVNASIITS
jgi:hypothetical protein